jgi:DNA-binding CsgD family transcriptional regulator
MLTIVPLRTEVPWPVPARPAAIVFIGDGAADPVPVQLLQAVFRLTPTQAALAREIARGDGIEAAATRLGISRATARAHLAAVFTKTKTTRQAELVRLLLRCIPQLREE